MFVNLLENGQDDDWQDDGYNDMNGIDRIGGSDGTVNVDVWFMSLLCMASGIVNCNGCVLVIIEIDVVVSSDLSMVYGPKPINGEFL